VANHRVLGFPLGPRELHARGSTSCDRRGERRPGAAPAAGTRLRRLLPGAVGRGRQALGSTGRPTGPRWTLGARREPQVRPVSFRLDDRRLPFPGQVLDGVSIEWRSWNFRRVRSLISDGGGGDDLPDALSARRWPSAKPQTERHVGAGESQQSIDVVPASCTARGIVGGQGHRQHGVHTEIGGWLSILLPTAGSCQSGSSRTGRPPRLGHRPLRQRGQPCRPTRRTTRPMRAGPWRLRLAGPPTGRSRTRASRLLRLRKHSCPIRTGDIPFDVAVTRRRDPLRGCAGRALQ
jgi:hypothetical protein